MLLTGIRRLADRIAVFSSRDFTRLVETAAANIEKPAMIDASKSAVLESAVTQIGAPVRSMDIQKSRLAAWLAEQN
jgi:hypothetical protein